ncbi:hypothetical protein [Halobacterium sp. R2-5]|uniref:hypothetical protein n=1 Tax=Halobacterium sp. R2-5 TaxID=2715751 RepID=UPI001422EC34|nr:hypothetical protein [Halobacterium sp. R2-5]NIC01035.1 hypothetical protein [Halobacterium sp. R2-5]
MPPTITNLEAGDHVWVAWIDSNEYCRAEQLRVQDSYQAAWGTYVVTVSNSDTDTWFQLVQAKPVDDVYSLVAIPGLHDRPNDQIGIYDAADYTCYPVFGIARSPGSLLWQILVRMLEMGFSAEDGMDIVALEMDLYPAEEYTEIRRKPKSSLRADVYGTISMLIKDTNKYHDQDL